MEVEPIKETKTEGTLEMENLQEKQEQQMQASPTEFKK